MIYIDKIYEIEEIKEKLTPIFEEYNITKAIVIGSYAQGDMIPHDDLDLVISSERTFGLEEYYQFVRKLHRALQIKIDITFEEYINPFIQNDLDECSVVIYEK